MACGGAPDGCAEKDRMSLRSILILPALLMVLGSGCYSGFSADVALTAGSPDASGSAGDEDPVDGEDSGDSGDGPDSPVDAACGDAPLEISAAPLRRLTAEQYRNTVTDLFGPGFALEDAITRLELFIDGKAGGFASTTAPADTEVVRNYMLLAESISVATAEQDFAASLGCDTTTEACIDTFLADFGRRAFRRPLSGDEQVRYLDLWASQNGQHGPDVALQTLVTALLSSPNFLYLEEPVTGLETAASVVALESYALASRLSYFLWASSPDVELLDRAEDATLLENDTLSAEIERMIEDPRFDRALASFHLQWTRTSELDTFQSNDPVWVDGLGSSMQEELVRFTRHVFRDGEGTIEALLTANYSFVDSDLASLYGVEAPANDFDRVELDGTQRAGLLTQAGFLTKTGAIFQDVHRGLFVRSNLLCFEPLPPPSDVELDPQVNRLEENPCVGCHIYMDTIGFGFNAYDELGRYRTELDGQSIDSSGEVIAAFPGGAEGTFEGATELAQLLAGSEEVEHCMAVQWSRFATGRLDTKTDECAMDELALQVTETGGDLRALVRSVASSAWFRSRAATDFSN